MKIQKYLFLNLFIYLFIYLFRSTRKDALDLT